MRSISGMTNHDLHKGFPSSRGGCGRGGHLLRRNGAPVRGNYVTVPKTPQLIRRQLLLKRERENAVAGAKLVEGRGEPGTSEMEKAIGSAGVDVLSVRDARLSAGEAFAEPAGRSEEKNRRGRVLFGPSGDGELPTLSEKKASECERVGVLPDDVAKSARGEASAELVVRREEVGRQGREVFGTTADVANGVDGAPGGFMVRLQLSTPTEESTASPSSVPVTTSPNPTSSSGSFCVPLAGRRESAGAVSALVGGANDASARKEEEDDDGGLGESPGRLLEHRLLTADVNVGGLPAATVSPEGFAAAGLPVTSPPSSVNSAAENGSGLGSGGSSVSAELTTGGIFACDNVDGSVEDALQSPSSSARVLSVRKASASLLETAGRVFLHGTTTQCVETEPSTPLRQIRKLFKPGEGPVEVELPTVVTDAYPSKKFVTPLRDLIACPRCNTKGITLNGTSGAVDVKPARYRD